MALVHRQRVEYSAVDAGFWNEFARLTRDWTGARQLALADVVVLAPFAELLPHARRAFAAGGGWQPRIETTQTLAASLPPALTEAGVRLTFDVASDRVHLTADWERQAWAREWSDTRSRRLAIAQVVELAHDLARAAAQVAPAQRAAHWALALSALPGVSGPGALERRLARWALEWAQRAPAPRSDALFALRPAAWIWLQCGGADRLVHALAQAGDAPAMCADVDGEPSDPLIDCSAAPLRWRCLDFEQEAQACTQQVLLAVNAGQTPVALIALDRLLVRRVRALLEREPALRLRDETGWTLSTTRAAARVMSTLRAARPAASRDEQLEALTLAAHAVQEEADALDALACAWRWRRTPDERALTAWQTGLARLVPLRRATRCPLPRWVQILRDVLADQGLLDDPDDPALQAVLRLLEPDAPALHEVGDAALDLEGFIGWLDDALESARYVPESEGEADVVVTPLARAVLRPFGAAVCAGADERRLGQRRALRSLVPTAALGALGLDGPELPTLRDAQALRQLLRLPRLTLLRRCSDAGEVLAPSALVERAATVAARAGQPWPPERDAQLGERSVACTALTRPAPAAHELPPHLSVSQIEQLRDCPYRFFALTVLGLRSADELEREFGVSDYGQWLHDVLHRFHLQRVPGTDLDTESALLAACADGASVDAALDPATLLPWRQAFDLIAAPYLAWQRDRDEAGLRFVDGEVPLRADMVEWGLSVSGRIDRIDRDDHEQGASELIDYKTGGVDKLMDKVKRPLEDTQLILYGLLAQRSGLTTDAALHANYLRLSENDAPTEIKHPDLAQSMTLAQAGLAVDFAAVRAGAGLRAIGEEPVCNWCEARGLCRRDHWGKAL